MSDGGGCVVLLRHGQSETNAAGIFTGLMDVPLTRRGAQEAQHAAELLQRERFLPARIVSSPMRRAYDTAAIVRNRLHASVPLESDWRLNERSYGALTGRSKAEALQELGLDQYMASRRSLHGTPPPMADDMYAVISGSAAFERLPPEALPRTESLADVIDRVRPLWIDELLPAAANGAQVLVVAHGNSLRAMCAVIDDLTAAAVEALNIPTGQPLMYCIGGDRSIRNPHGTYLDVVAARNAVAKVAAEGGT